MAALVLALTATVAGCGGKPSSLFNQSGYYVRGDTVYYLKAFPGEAVTLDQADPDSFDILSSTYAKDRTTVYLSGVPLADADPASFVLLDGDYSKDADHVFLGDRVLTEDVARFAFLPDGGLTKDGDQVYWSDGSVLSEDPENFRVLSHEDYYLYAADSSAVYVNGNTIDGADPGSFEVTDGAYAQDGSRVFYFTDLVPGADAASLEVLDGSYARDRARAYWMGKVVPGADPASFVVLNGNFECTADDEHAYYRDVRIKGFDPATIPDGATVTNCSERSLSFS